MKPPIKLTLQIKSHDESNIHGQIYNEAESLTLHYNIKDNTLLLNETNKLDTLQNKKKGVALRTLIKTNEHQLIKIIRSAINGKVEAGQHINCVFIEGFNFLKESDFNRYIRVDRRHEQLAITGSDSETGNIHKIYADGSHACQTQQSGYGGFIETPDGAQMIFSHTFETGSSNLMELLAVTEGLRQLRPFEKIQVNTDSRFVIRGLAQWCHFWKHNNWQTAYGREVKYAEHWQQAYNLCQNKFIEFKWIKGHSGDQNQNFCHQLAKESSTRPVPHS
ncbi:ribonuclease H family protein [Geofilum sp. OHC36d9]|uniref:ribonuclease H family protein n=1 Tax=Geofilum sp. OHC36d9 TaxID=3458413 RepID=UPI0040340AF3